MIFKFDRIKFGASGCVHAMRYTMYVTNKFKHWLVSNVNQSIAVQLFNISGSSILWENVYCDLEVHFPCATFYWYNGSDWYIKKKIFVPFLMISYVTPSRPQNGVFVLNWQHVDNFKHQAHNHVHMTVTARVNKREGKCQTACTHAQTLCMHYSWSQLENKISTSLTTFWEFWLQ